jgi:hypothetical protein
VHPEVQPVGTLGPRALAKATDREQVARLAQPELAAAAAELLRERLGDNPEDVQDGVLDDVAAAHDLTRTFADGSSGTLPVASLRALARRELERRGREGWRALSPAHAGLRCVAALEGHDDEVRRLRPWRSGLLASVACGFDRMVWAVVSRRRLSRLRRADGLGDGVLLRRRHGEVAVFRPGVRSRRSRVPVPAGEIPAVSGDRFALVEGDQYGATVSVREITSGAVVFARGGYAWDTHVGDTLDVELSPGGRFLAVGAGYGTHLEIVDLAGGRERTFSSAGTRPCLVALGPEPWAVLSLPDGHEVVDLESGRTALRLEGAQGPAVIDERAATLVRGVGSTVEMRDLGGGLFWRHHVGGAVDDVQVSPDGELAAAVVRGDWSVEERSYRPTAHLWRRDGTEVGSIEGAYAVALLSDGRTAATGGRWGTIWLWATQ